MVGARLLVVLGSGVVCVGALASIAGFGAAVHAVRFPDFLLRVPLRVTAPADVGVFVSGTPDPPSSRRSDTRFGLTAAGHRDDKPGATLIELQDASTGRTVAAISCADWHASNGRDWEPSRSDGDESSNEVVGKMTIQTSDGEMTFVRTSEQVGSPFLPLSRGIRVSLSVEARGHRALRAVFTCEAEGALAIIGRTVCVTSTDPSISPRSSIFAVWPSDARIALAAPGAGRLRAFTVTMPVITTVPGEQVEVFSVLLTGSTSPHVKDQLAQAAALNEYGTQGTVRPEIQSHSSIVDLGLNRGDTLLHKVVYYNVGTSPATGFSVVTPVPSGSELVAESLAGSDVVPALVRSKVESRSTDRVVSVRWNFRSPILPGEERWVVYRTVDR